MRHCVCLLLVLIATTFDRLPEALAQNKDAPSAQPETPGTARDPNVPTPEQFLGFKPGDRPATPAQIAGYLELLGKASPRARLEVMGATHEGRPLVVLVVSSPANMQRLTEIHQTKARLGDPRQGVGDAQARRQIKSLPAVAWLGYSIHGDEMSGADASMRVAYRLVAGEDDETRQWREQLIVYIDPLENPDGRHRAVAAVEAGRGIVPNPDTSSLPFAAMWPYGRGNHYLFDLNRDWFTLIQPESRARVQKITSVLPQLMVDAHEMRPDSTFLFSPPRAPFNSHRPRNGAQWADTFARDQAAAFDSFGWSYYTREWNEEFFPGYGSSWGKYLGAVGILYEQSRTLGSTIKQRSGLTVTYADAVERQFISSLVNLHTLFRNRETILRDWVDTRREAVRNNKSALMKAYVVPGAPYPGRVARLARTLLQQRIEVEQLEAPITIEGYGMFGGLGRVSLPPGSLRIRLNQPHAPLVRNLLDFHQPMGPAFLREQRRWLEQDKGSRLYETTAWSLPHSYGLDVRWTSAVPNGRWTRLTEIPVAPGTVHGEGSGYGYLFSGANDAAVTLAAQLLERGVALRVSREATTVGGQTYPRGSFLVKSEGNAASVAELLATLTPSLGLDVFSVGTALAQRGTDLGGENFQPLVSPRVAVIAGYPVSPDGYGFVWHLLDREAGLRVSRLSLDRLANVDLRRYNVLVLPPGWNLEAYQARLHSSILEKLKTWVAEGGTLIGLGSGAEVLTDPKAGVAQSRFRRHALATYPSVVLGLDPKAAEAAGRLRAVGLRGVLNRDKPAPPSTSGWSDVSRPYSVPPVYGPGARPFVTSGGSGFKFPKQPPNLHTWMKGLAPLGDDAKKRFVEQADERLRRFMATGAYLSTEVDPDHWLGYGAQGRMPVFFDSADALIAEAPAQTAVRFSNVEALHLGGLLWPEAAGRVARTAYAVRESHGRGQVILFSSDPNFRGAAFATQRLFLNAVVLGPGLGTTWPSPW